MTHPGFKLTVLTKRKEGMSLEDFKKHTLEVHVPLVKAIPGVKLYIQNFVEHGDEPAPFDLVTEVWFDSKEDMEKGYASPEGEAAKADVPLFISEIHTMVVEEHILLD